VKSLRCFPIALLIGLSTCAPSVPQQKLATVTFLVFDSFGRPQSDCHILEFVSLDDERNPDYVAHFSGAVGRNIPYGSTYRVHAKCADERSGGTFLVTVNKSDTLLVLASWLNLGDYVTGPSPRLTIRIRSNNETKLAEKTWIKIVGVYVDRMEVARVSPSGTAGFFDVVPGKYLMLLFGDGLVCTKEIEFLKAPADLELSISAESCKVQSQSAVRAED
jgi:hypothetical protein